MGAYQTRPVAPAPDVHLQHDDASNAHANRPAAASAPVGLRLAVFRELLAEAALVQPRERVLRWDGTRHTAGEPLTTVDVVLEVVKPHTLARKCAYLEVLPVERKATATVYVSHAWKYIFSDVVSALEQAVDKDDGIWFCAFINNQHETGSMTYEFLEGEFRRNIESVGRVMLVFAPWGAPISLKRVWCLFKIFVCVDRGIPLEVAMPATQLIDFRRALVKDFDSICSALSKIALDEAEATKPEDKANILRAVGANVGVGQLNKQVLSELRAWLAQTGGAALTAEPGNLGLTDSLGRLLQAQGKLGEAEPLLRRALEGREEQLGESHPDTLASVNNLAVLLKAQGKLAEAEPLYRRALEGHEKQFGASHLNTLNSVNNLAALLQAQDKLDESEPLLRRALEGCKDQLGASHPRALKGREKQLGASHLDTLTFVNNLAALLKAQGKLAEAEPLFRRALEGREKQLGASHPDILTSVSSLASLLQVQGKLVEAEPLYMRALEGRETQFGASHPDTLTSVNDLALLLQAQGNLADAEPLLRRALEVVNEHLGASHPNTLIFGTLGDAEPLLRPD
ncbi:hypothetical protein T492DRAFT_1117215 [Pavlovales sp. CCMP2436]|nr:hypothetical protein T492DRAFT_1117215 [Pavlovales sp. CCMP2436]